MDDVLVELERLHTLQHEQLSITCTLQQRLKTFPLKKKGMKSHTLSFGDELEGMMKREKSRRCHVPSVDELGSVLMRSDFKPSASFSEEITAPTAPTAPSAPVEPTRVIPSEVADADADADVGKLNFSRLNRGAHSQILENWRPHVSEQGEEPDDRGSRILLKTPKLLYLAIPLQGLILLVSLLLQSNHVYFSTIMGLLFYIAGSALQHGSRCKTKSQDLRCPWLLLKSLRSRDLALAVGRLNELLGCIFLCILLCICLCICLYICLYICLFICLCICLCLRLLHLRRFQVLCRLQPVLEERLRSGLREQINVLRAQANMGAST